MIFFGASEADGTQRSLKKKLGERTERTCSGCRASMMTRKDGS